MGRAKARTNPPPLGPMREEGELDIFLPLFLSGMGHEIVSRAHRGVRQHGVDIAPTGLSENGRKTLYLWLMTSSGCGGHRHGRRILV